MSYSSLAVTAAVALTVVGMMFVVGGVLMEGLFLPGVVLIGISLVVYAVAGVLHVREPGPAVRASSRPAV